MLNPNETLEIPVIHSNGSGRENLLNQLTDARYALSKAIGTLQDTQPHMRDYYVKPDAPACYIRAMEQHTRRMAMLGEVDRQLAAIGEEISDA